MAFFTFMNGADGRTLRAVVGAALLLWGFFGLTGGGRIVALVLGVVFLLSAALDICGLNLLRGLPIQSSRAREMLRAQH